MKNFIFSLAISLFFGISFGQTITVSDPNGGEILHACEQYLITWNTSGSLSDYYNIDYSLDGGTIWASVTSNYLSTNGEFLWTVPNVQSSTCLIRVKDALTPSIIDQSDAFFTINIPIVLTSPNGGEVWQSGTTEDITWNIIGTSNTYDIHYSLDNGSSWVLIVNNYSNSTGVYSWNIPTVIPSTNCLIRVRDHVQNCMTDESDLVFTIIPPQPILSSPNGGEVLEAGCYVNITWWSSTFFSSVKLEYSIDNGASWSIISNGANNDGSQSWTPPVGTVSDSCLIRASNSADNTLFDISDDVFSIRNPLEILTPAAGDTVWGCSDFPITFRKPYQCISRINIAYSINNGASWVTLVTNRNVYSTALTYTYTWNDVPNNINTTQALFRVQNYYNTSTFAESVDTFVIHPSNDITVTSPNGGEVFAADSVHTITWTNKPAAPGPYYFYLFDGNSWVIVATGLTGNSYDWTVPVLNASNCKIRITDQLQTCKFDESDNDFTITPPQPILSSPNGGEVLEAGCYVNITWWSSTFFSSVKLEYSIDNGASWSIISNGANNDGSQSWTPPVGTVSDSCLIRASNSADNTLFDISDDVFSIRNPLEILTPAAGDTVWGCSDFPITFRKPYQCISRINIAYSINNGASWVTLVTNRNVYSTALTYTYTWNDVPNNINTTQALFRVQNYYNTSTFAESVDTFVIHPSNDITVTSPNGGEVFAADSVHTITWTNKPAAPGPYYFYLFDGNSWVIVATGLTGNSYDWTVPVLNASNCKIRITDQLQTCKFDESDNDFTITPPQPILSSPNGGEVLEAGCYVNITWWSSTFFSSVKLEYSIDNGASWSIISNGANNDGSQSWTPPVGTVSDSCLIRASNSADNTLFDISDDVFSIRNPLEILTPAAGDTVWGCSDFPITFRKPYQCISRVNIAYSINNGASWVTLVTNRNVYSTALTYTYTWNDVPNNINTTQALFRVQNYYNTSTFAESVDTFVIHPSNDITVTSPNGGEVFAADSVHTITWTNKPAAPGPYYFYLFDGNSWVIVATGLTGNSYDWTVPVLNASNCKIRITDQLQTCKFDESDNDFTITPPQPILSSPNGGEVLEAGCYVNITWWSSTFFSSVKLEYSIDNGASWSIISNGANNDGSQSWTPPVGTVSDSCLIRASNSADNTLFDISDDVFSIRNPLEILTPAAGDTVWGCSDFPITFRKPYQCISRVNIAYSINNGASWVTLVTNRNVYSTALTYTYTWNDVPNNINTTQALFRVQNYYNTSTFAESVDTFVIHPSNDITVTSPNGGEVFAADSVHTITWTNKPAAPGPYYFYLFDGNSWVIVATGLTGNSYDWTVPVLNASNCKIRITDQLQTCKFDESDNDFTITPPQPILSSPNGGEVLEAGCYVNITWWSSTFFSSVKLEYSIDNGASWSIISNGANNDGSQSWTPPVGTVSDSCLIRASNSADNTLFDISDDVFSIRNPLEILTPAAGDTVWGCSDFPITFRKPYQCISRVNIAYSINNGASWVTLVTNRNVYSTALTYTYTWNDVPNNINTTQALFRVQNYYNTSTFAESVDTFVIHPSNDITVTSPNGGEVFAADSVHTITWTNKPAAPGPYYFYLFDGNSWVIVATGLTGNSYDWTVPVLNASNCKIRITDQLQTCKFDESDNDFTITPPQPILSSPNGGEVWYSKEYKQITWYTSTFYTNVKLEYTIDDGLNWIVITNSTTNDGSQNWSIPNVSSTNCRVRISNVGNPSLFDVSDQVFEIRPAVTILTPNGDNGFTQWGGCTVTSITFDHTPYYDDWRIKYSINNGVTWNTINNNWNEATNPATYNWFMPNINSSDVLVSVEPYNQASYVDESDSTFTILQPVTIIQPNYGGIMQVGTNYDIIWISDGISNIYDLDYTTNNGATWTNIATGYVTSTNTYTWNVPNQVSNNCRVRITDNIENCKTHISDVAFIISTTAPPLNVTTPNGLDTLVACEVFPITWSETSVFGTYDISYSQDAGASYIPIVTNYSTTSASYNWTVPNISSSDVLLKVQNTGTADFDLSDALFSIEANIIETYIFDTICGNETYTLPNGSIVNATGLYLDTLNSVSSCDSVVTINLIASLEYSDTIYSTSCNSANVGTVTQNLNNKFGCDSIITSIITLLTSYNTTINDTICNDQNYTLPDASNVNTTGTYTTTIQANNSCDSVITTNLVVNPTHNITVNLTSCNVTDTGSVVQNLMNQFGCDSIVTTNTSLLPSDAVTVNLSSCYTADTGTVVQNLTNQFMCDSIVTTITTLLPSDAVTVNLSSCNPADTGTLVQNLTNQFMCDSIVTTITTLLQSDSFTLNLTSCNSADAGTVVSNLSNQFGCDSIVTTITTLLSSSSTTVNDTICANENYILPDASIVNTSGIYTTTLQANNSCDSVITTNLEVNHIHNITLNLTSCNPNDTGTVIQNLINQFACDSIITTITSLLASNETTFNLTSCNPADTGTVVQNLMNQNNCDSIVTTITTLLTSDLITVNLLSCNPSDTGTSVQNLMNQFGCDSIVTIITTLLTSDSVTMNLTSCNPSDVGTITTTLNNQFGCDSILTTITTLLPSFDLTINDTICANDIYTLPDATLVNTSGIYTTTLQAVNTCDSIITTNLIVNPIHNIALNLTSCNPNDTGTLVQNLLNQFGCDSIITTITTLLISDETTVNLTSCNLADTGTVVQYLTNQNNCDSIVTTITTLLHSDSVSLSLASCNPNDVGTITITLNNQFGCDSIVTTITSLLPSNAVTVNLTSCNPNDIGTVVSNFTNQYGCDSIVTTNTSLIASSNSTINVSICESETYTLPDASTVNTAGTYTTTLTAVNTCDSVITTNLSVKEEYFDTESIEICSGENYIFPDGSSQSNITSSITYLSNLISSNNCDSTIETTVNVNPIVTSVAISGNVLTADMNSGSYQWINCADNLDIAGATNQSYTPTANGEYAVKIEVNTCTAVSECIKVLSIGIEEQIGKLLLIYPNPNQGVFKLQISEFQNEDIELNIYDMNAKLIKTDMLKAFETETTLDLKNLSSGQYIIRMATSKFSTAKKFTIFK